YGHARGEHAVAGYAGFLRDLLEFAVAEIVVEDVAWRRLAVRQVRAVGEKEIGQAVVIEIDPRHAGAESLRHELFFRRAVLVLERNSGFPRHVDELDARLGRICATERAEKQHKSGEDGH